MLTDAQFGEDGCFGATLHPELDEQVGNASS